MEAAETQAPPNGRKLGGTHENCRRLYGWNVHRLSSIALWKPSCVQPEPAELSEVLTASSDAPPAQGERTDVARFHALGKPKPGRVKLLRSLLGYCTRYSPRLKAVCRRLQ